MKKQKHRVEPKVESDYMGGNPSIFKTNNIVKVDTNAGQLPGLEDIAHSDSGSAPFILVDSVHLRTPNQLHTALLKREKKRMKHVQRQCSLLPLLEYTSPALGAQPTTPTEKAAQEDLDFQEDLKLLTLAELKKDMDWEDPLAIYLKTPLANTSSTEDITQSSSRIKSIRDKLENLRECQQQKELLGMESEQVLSPSHSEQISAVSHSEQLPSPSQSEPPRIKREGTFNIVREESTLIPQLHSSYYYTPEQAACQEPFNHANSSSQFPKKRSSLSKARSSADLLDQEFPNMLMNGFQSKNAKESEKLSRIINQIGDLLLQLPQEKLDKELAEKSSYSFLVTIKPNQCTTNMKSSYTSRKSGSSSLAHELPPANNPVVSIFSLASTNDANSLFLNQYMDAKEKVIDPLLGSNPSQLKGSSQSLIDNRSPASDISAQAQSVKTRTFLKMPSKLLKKLGM